MQDSDGEKSDDNLVVDVSNEVCLRLTSCSYSALTMTSVLTISIHNVFLISSRTHFTFTWKIDVLLILYVTDTLVTAILFCDALVCFTATVNAHQTFVVS